MKAQSTQTQSSGDGGSPLANGQSNFFDGNKCQNLSQQIDNIRDISGVSKKKKKKKGTKPKGKKSTQEASDVPPMKLKLKHNASDPPLTKETNVNSNLNNQWSSDGKKTTSGKGLGISGVSMGVGSGNSYNSKKVVLMEQTEPGNRLRLYPKPIACESE